VQRIGFVPSLLGSEFGSVVFRQKLGNLESLFAGLLQSAFSLSKSCKMWKVHFCGCLLQRGFCSVWRLSSKSSKSGLLVALAPNKACRLTCCHVPFRGFFSLEKHFPVSWVGSRGNTQLTQTVRRWAFISTFKSNFKWKSVFITSALWLAGFARNAAGRCKVFFIAFALVRAPTAYRAASFISIKPATHQAGSHSCFWHPFIFLPASCSFMGAFHSDLITWKPVVKSGQLWKCFCQWAYIFGASFKSGTFHKSRWVNLAQTRYFMGKVFGLFWVRG